jgi:hypothetical protein
MEESHSRKVNISLASQEIPCILENTKVYCHIHKIPSFVSTMIPAQQQKGTEQIKQAQNVAKNKLNH